MRLKLPHTLKPAFEIFVVTWTICLEESMLLRMLLYCTPCSWLGRFPSTCISLCRRSCAPTTLTLLLSGRTARGRAAPPPPQPAAPGGAPANVACAVSKLGGSFAFVGKVRMHQAPSVIAHDDSPSPCVYCHASRRLLSCIRARALDPLFGSL